MIIGWVAGKLGISSFLTSIILYGVAAGALLYIANCYVNKVGDEQYQKGQEKLADTLDKMKKAEWAEVEKGQQARLEEIELSRSKLDAEMKAIMNARQAWRSELTKGLAEIQKKAERSNVAIMAIPPNELDSNIRGFIADYIKSHPDFVPIVPFDTIRK